MDEMKIVLKMFQASDAMKEIKNCDASVLKIVEKYLKKLDDIVKQNPSESSRVLHEIDDTGFIDAVISYCYALKWLDSASKRLASYEESLSVINNPDVLMKLKEELDGDDNM